VPFAVKGLLWYQGENDKGNRQYALMLRAMVADWQRRFVNGDRFPVYFMQLQRSGDYCSPLIREEQFRAVAIPDSGMAVLMDLDVNVHPVNKFDSGERLALWALSKDYGKTGIVCSGPLYKGYEIKADKITISFDYAEGGLRLGTKEMMDPPVFDPEGTMTNVEIRGEKSRNWVKARTRIEGDKLIAWSPEVAAPVAARYCYENTPAGPFLYTPAGLPAAQFSTETKELQ